MRKLLVYFLITYCSTFSLWTFDLSGAVHVDTYTGSPSVGVSFSAQENITDLMVVRAQADYLTAKNYDIQTLILGVISRFTFGGGFALGIKNNTQIPIVPGIGFLFGVQATDNFGFETSAILTFTPSELAKIYDLRAKIDFLYRSENTDSSISYTLKKGVSTDELVNSLNLEVEAFEEGIPVGLLVGSGLDFFMASGDRGIDVHVMGGLSFITTRFGTYIAKAKVGVLSHNEDIGVPFDIAVGAKFSF